MIATLATSSVLFACTGVDSDLFGPAGTDTSSDSGSGDARSTKDGGRGTAGDSGINPPVDSGGGHPGDVVPAVCGDSLTCNKTDPTCCALQGDGLVTPTSYSCTANGTECTGMANGAPIQCRDNSDCSGGTPICCGELKDPSATGGYNQVHCASSCQEKDDAGQYTTHVIFCANSDVCAADGLTCAASTLMPGFNVCGAD